MLSKSHRFTVYCIQHRAILNFHRKMLLHLIKSKLLSVCVSVMIFFFTNEKKFSVKLVLFTAADFTLGDAQKKRQYSVS